MILALRPSINSRDTLTKLIKAKVNNNLLVQVAHPSRIRLEIASDTSYSANFIDRLKAPFVVTPKDFYFDDAYYHTHGLYLLKLLFLSSDIVHIARIAKVTGMIAPTNKFIKMPIALTREPRIHSAELYKTPVEFDEIQLIPNYWSYPTEELARLNKEDMALQARLTLRH